MNKYLIINLGRMGDLVETIPAIMDLKQENSENQVTLLAAEPFASLAYHIPVLDKVIPLNLSNFMLPHQEDTLLNRYQILDDFAKELRDANYDVVLNFTHTKTSAALCHLLGVPDTRGLTLDQQGFQLVRNPWLFYFFVSNLNRPFNQFNLVDLYRRSVGSVQSPGRLVLKSSAGGDKEANELWQKRRIPTDRPIIGLAVGASNHTKRWLPDHFVRLTELLHQSRNAHFLILGNKDDQPTAREITTGKDNYFSDLTTKTSMSGLISVLKRCDLLISNDTGTMHVAAAVGTPTIALVMGTALGSETAPYHTKGLVIQSLHPCAPCGYTNLCKDARCRMDINPEIVAQCIEALLSSPDGIVTQIPDTPDLEKVQIFQGDFDSDGLFDLYPLIKRPLNNTSLIDRILRRVWLQFLESPQPDLLTIGAVDRWVKRVVEYCCDHFDVSPASDLQNQYRTKEKPELLKPINYLDQGIQLAGELLTASQIHPLDLTHIKSLGDHLAQIDQELESLGHTQQMLRAFHIYFNLRKGSLLETDLEGQAQETQNIYRDYKLQLLLSDRMLEGVLTGISPGTIKADPKTVTTESKSADINSNDTGEIALPTMSDSDGIEWGSLRQKILESMDVKIPIPTELAFHEVSQHQLVIAPEKAAWITFRRDVFHTSSQILQLLRKSLNVGECVIELVEHSGIPVNSAIETVKNLVDDLTKQGFRSDIPPLETTLEDNPPNLQLFLTRKCNLRCTHCYASAGEALSGELSTNEWIKVLDDYSAMKAGNVVTFSGGEPLIHPEFDTIARHAKNLGNKVYLLTNGVAINSSDRARSIADVVDSVQLSLEGTQAEIHDAIRGQGSFHRAIKGLEHLLTAGIPVEMVFVVLPSNVSDLCQNLGDFIQSFHNPNLSVALGVVNFVGRARDLVDDTSQSLVGKVVDVYKDAEWLRKGSWMSNRIVHGCPLANSVVVDADGRITTCPYLHYHSPYRVGQLPLSEAVTFDHNWHAQIIRRNPKCQNCDLRNLPCGGCMVLQTPCSNQILERAYYRMVFGR